MAASWFEPVFRLDAAHHLNVAPKYAEHNCSGIFGEIEYAKFYETQTAISHRDLQPAQKVEFHTTSVIDALCVSPALAQIWRELFAQALLVYRLSICVAQSGNLLLQFVSRCGDTLMQCAECGIPKARLSRRVSVTRCCVDKATDAVDNAKHSLGVLLARTHLAEFQLVG